MQVTNAVMDRPFSMTIQNNVEKQTKFLDNQGAKESFQQPDKVSSSRLSGTYSEMNSLKSIQASYITARKTDSYLEKLQKVLERFKEYNQEIAREALSPKDHNPEAAEKFFQKVSGRLVQDIEQLVKEYPMLKDVTKELGNLRVTSAIGLNQTLSDVISRREAISGNLRELGSKVRTEQSDIMKSLRGSQMPSSLHKLIKPETTMKLLDK